MSRSQPPHLSQADLAEFLRQEERRAAKPDRVPVSQHVAESTAAGAGGAILLAVAASAAGAPWELTAQWSILAGGAVLAVGLLLRIVPGDKQQALRRMRQFRETARQAEARLQLACREIERMEAEHAADRAQQQQALTELRNELRTAQAEVNRYREERRTPNFVTVADVTAQPDAAKILEHWFATLRTDDKGRTRGDWWSRPKSEAAGWGRSRQPAAAELLRKAGIVDMNSTVPYVLPRFDTLDAALFALNKFCGKSSSEPDIPRQQAVMSNDEYD